MAAALKVSGTVTVLWFVGLTCPAPTEAQGLGTMQVVASVVRADAAWAGLSGARQVARQFAAAPNDEKQLRLDLSLTRIELEFPAHTPEAGRVQPAISINYLHN